MTSSSRWVREGAVSTIGRDLDKNFRPINILIFRNGDMYDQGTEVSVTRRQFPNWLTLLDYLTEKLRLTEGAVHAIYTMLGQEVRTFQELENGQWYVGAHGKFRPAAYGAKVPRQWKGAMASDALIWREPKGLASKESLEMYLRRRGYKPIVGDIWDDSQFDLMKSNGLFSSKLAPNPISRCSTDCANRFPLGPPARRRDFQVQQKRRAPSRTRSADGVNGRRNRVDNTRRSKTEETLRRTGLKANLGVIRKARSLPSAAGTRLPNRMVNQLVVNGRHSNLIYNRLLTHQQGRYQSGRPGTATLSSRAETGRSLASEATRRAMQWNAKQISRAPTPAPPPPPPPAPPKPSIDDEETNMYKPVDPKVAKLYEDRAYQFYERQKELELKRELLERAAKRPPGAENILKTENGNGLVGVSSGLGRSVYGKRVFLSPVTAYMESMFTKHSQTCQRIPFVSDQYARQPYGPPANRPAKPPPYRLPPAQIGQSLSTSGHSTLLASSGRRQIPPLKTTGMIATTSQNLERATNPFSLQVCISHRRKA